MMGRNTIRGRLARISSAAFPGCAWDFASSSRRSAFGLSRSMSWANSAPFITRRRNSSSVPASSAWAIAFSLSGLRPSRGR
jgi:hypothetical protein